MVNKKVMRAIHLGIRKNADLMREISHVTYDENKLDIHAKSNYFEMPLISAILIIIQSVASKHFKNWRIFITSSGELVCSFMF